MGNSNKLQKSWKSITFRSGMIPWLLPNVSALFCCLFPIIPYDLGNQTLSC